ncbi:MAG: hypothetical protein HZB77_02565 [Chloroflexi bacterium]|nr:hypothetical protein [Chloroflexota bacterium]
MSRFIRILLLLFVLLNTSAPLPVAASPYLQTPTPPNPVVARFLSSLTPEEKVGQLFVITFNGTATDENSAIYDLITRYHVGGVMLQSANDNFADGETFKPQLLTLTSNLQSIATLGTASQRRAATPTPARPNFPTEVAPSKQYIPLLIAMQYEGDISSTSLMMSSSGMTPLPSSMGIGATWNAAHAETIGKIVGQEFSALGLNFLIGPTLDVIDSPQPTGSADLGARAFGGDPYWVGVMGKSFITGVHGGSNGRIAVISRHFPGYGASDRSLDEQVPTVSKSLQQLTAIDLQPFFAVTKGSASSTTDALLVSHIRYRGFQGNIRDTTRPISFDQQALGVLLGSSELSSWRAAGGVAMSDSLGVRVVRRLYDATGRTFPAFTIARDAFLAGNDLLYLSQFGLDPQKDQADTIKAVLTQFVQKYREDPAFAARVDESVARIIAMKLKLYSNSFNIDAVLPSANLSAIGANPQTTFNVVRDAVTLVSPTQTELADRLPAPPNTNQRIALFTDVRTTKQCATCPVRSIIATDALQQAILRLYGPQGTREISPTNLTSFAFGDLVSYLDGKKLPAANPTPAAGAATPPTPPDVGETITRADWLVFSMLDVKPTSSSSNALVRILSERPDLIKGKRVIVFAFDAPYYLDTTSVAQLTAYYAVYSRTPISIEVAARVLFQEITPIGFSPVSISAVGYNLIEATQPDPKQVIKLFTDVLQPEFTVTPTPVPRSTATPVPFALNSVVGLRTGVILDRKGHQVPDGTVVKFYATYVSEGLTVLISEATTSDGVARAGLRLDRSGLINVSAISEPALASFTLQFNTQQPAPPRVITPTPEPSNTPRFTDTPVVTATSSARRTPTPEPAKPEGTVQGGDLLVALFALIVIGGFGWVSMRERGDPISAGVKLILIVAIAIWGSYDFYALNLPGASMLYGLGSWAVVFVVWGGGLIGLGIGWFLLKPSKS